MKYFMGFLTISCDRKKYYPFLQFKLLTQVKFSESIQFRLWVMLYIPLVTFCIPLSLTIYILYLPSYLVICFIPFTFIHFIFHFYYINIYNRILSKIHLKICFTFNKLQHYNRIVDTFEMSSILNIIGFHYLIIHHEIISYFSVFT